MESHEVMHRQSSNHQLSQHPLQAHPWQMNTKNLAVDRTQDPVGIPVLRILYMVDNIVKNWQSNEAIATLHQHMQQYDDQEDPNRNMCHTAQTLTRNKSTSGLCRRHNWKELVGSNWKWQQHTCTIACPATYLVEQLQPWFDSTWQKAREYAMVACREQKHDCIHAA